ncbi:MAG TPA: surface-adhesin E family protein [Nitrospiraceae bacterium]|nr:surface-adhesin E family protein [Nitrospiraceae bacterium]
MGPFLTLPLAYLSGFWLLIIFLVLSSSPAFAEWVKHGTAESGTTVYADPDTIYRNGDLVKMEVLFDFKTIQTKAGASYLSAKAQMEYDCAELRFEGLAVMYFSGNMGSGKLLDRSSSIGKWLPVSRGSLDEALSKVACGKQ